MAIEIVTDRPSSHLILKEVEPGMSRTRKALLAVGSALALLGAYTATTAPAPTGLPSFSMDTVQLAASAACTFNDGDLISVQADTGNFLARCNNCIPGAASPDAAFFHVKQVAGNPWAVWKVTNTGNGKLALQADSGKYLARCNNCAPGASYPDEAFVHVSDWRSGPWAQWTCVDAGNGKIAFQADSGKFLARCNNCVRASSPDTAFVHVAAWNSGPWAQFTVKRLPSPACTFTDGTVIGLQADSGKFLSRCNNCVPGAAYPDSAFVHVSQLAGNPWSQWKVYNTDNGKLALQADSGNFLARCNNCARNAAYPDEAFVHVKNWRDGPWATFTCVDAGNGKIALQADSGKFLSRCNNCVGAAYPDSAMFHVSTPAGNPWSQWTVVKP
ncbi:cytochrome P450 [Achlya hypogyna]|uniref:Cytochrome P450 n=1 Tax=Achlya hypogyna TaxID=1202772 RepID=A0A1V9YZX7_ACHHY|nr:cytochrome P450 [Achlya hypogyna]